MVSKPEPGVRVSVESENAPEEDFATRRSREIANKALEIEKVMRFLSPNTSNCHFPCPPATELG